VCCLWTAESHNFWHCANFDNDFRTSEKLLNIVGGCLWKLRLSISFIVVHIMRTYLAFNTSHHEFLTVLTLMCLPSNRQDLSYDDCLEDKKEDIGTVLHCTVYDDDKHTRSSCRWLLLGFRFNFWAFLASLFVLQLVLCNAYYLLVVWVSWSVPALSIAGKSSSPKWSVMLRSRRRPQAGDRKRANLLAGSLAHVVPGPV